MKLHPRLLSCSFLLALVHPSPAAQFKLGAHTFTVPDGFEVELVAGTDLVPRPVSGSFDELGRLYVTDSSGSNVKPAEQTNNPANRVLRLEDTNGDGKFDKSVVFADKVMFPEGCLWYDGSVYVAAPPHIWKFTDTNNDGVADQRTVWFDGKTLTGCANDLHGPYLGPDGYIYWTKGAFAEQTHVLGNGRTLNDRAAHIFRARPDGSDLDVIMTGGMDNPVEVDFTPEGEAIFTSTFIDFSQPGFRDGIGHAIYGGVFGKVQEAIEDRRVKRTSPEVMHPFYQAGPSAICALSRYRSGMFGPEYRDNFFATSFNLRKVTRHVLQPKGATYASTDSDFLVSDNSDFHPTDVLEAADGSLIVVDTGGWYKLCCPSSQLAKPDVLGGIYRVKRTGATPVAAGSLVKSPPADERVLAAKRISLQRDAGQAARLRRHVESFGPGSAVTAPLARVSAEALGRVGDRASVPALLELAHRAGADEALVHSAIFALIEIAAPAATRAGLRSDRPRSQRAALIALDQLDAGSLKPEEVLPFLLAPDAELRRTAAWVAGHHPEWGGTLAGFFRERLAASNLPEADRAELEKQLAQFVSSDAVQPLLVESLRTPATTPATRQMLFRLMARSGLKDAPAGWAEAVRIALDLKDDVLVRAAIAAARSMSQVKNHPPSFVEPLQKLARDTTRSDDLRLEALAALPRGLPAVETELMTFLLANVDLARSVAARGAAAGVLVKATLNDGQLVALAEALQAAGPMEVAKLLPAFEHSTNEATGLRLMAALKESKGLAGVQSDALKAVAKKYPATVQQKADALLATLNADAEQQKAQLDALLTSLPPGDVRRGQLVFNHPKAACASCHRMGYLGGDIGPDLTAIGPARTERDLLEAVVFPSASFVRSYEPYTVVTKGGDDYSGVLRRDAPEEVVLGTGANTEVRVARADIAELRPGRVSVMPAGLDQQLSKQELSDLITFLKNTKWGPN